VALLEGTVVVVLCFVAIGVVGCPMKRHRLTERTLLSLGKPAPLRAELSSNLETRQAVAKCELVGSH
jgi:hypothetical protein